MIDQMEARRELDALVAEQALEWLWVRFRPAHKKDAGFVRKLCPPDSFMAMSGHANGDEPLAQGWDFDLPHLSTDIAAAWPVVEHMTEIPTKTQGESDRNVQFMRWWQGADLWAYSAEEAALEICRAALRITAGLTD